MLDASWGETCRGGGLSIPPSVTDLAVVTIAAALLEANMRPPLSVDTDVTVTAVTMAADVANGARWDPAVNVYTDDGGAVNMFMQKVAVVSVISNAAKSALRAYFEGVNWPLNRAARFNAAFPTQKILMPPMH